MQGTSQGLAFVTLGGTRGRHFAGVSFKPRKLPDCPQGVRRQSPASGAHSNDDERSFSTKNILLSTQDKTAVFDENCTVFTGFG
jgi:hypothetical protein